MIVGLLIGKEHSVSTPGKNVRPVLGRPMAEYGMMAAAHTPELTRLFTSTDSEQIAEIGRRYGATHIPRPPELAAPDALTEDALTHAFDAMERETKQTIEIVALFFANAPTARPQAVSQGIQTLQDDVSLDSAVTVTRYNMWSPARARMIDAQGLLAPFVDRSQLNPGRAVTSIRGAEGDCYFADLAVQVLRRRCFTEMDQGGLPFRWWGRRTKPIVSDYGFDIDDAWQIPVVELWLLEHGFSTTKTPYGDGAK
jgi:CMP-N-acetylneuraminic acid synthetase